jgi:hypothetical protein
MKEFLSSFSRLAEWFVVEQPILLLHFGITSSGQWVSPGLTQARYVTLWK